MGTNLGESAKLAPNTSPARRATSSELFFRVYEDGFWARLKRDLWVLRYLARLFIRWLVFGGRLRRAWRRAEKEGRPLVLETTMRARR
jgi:hypothetical protein